MLIRRKFEYRSTKFEIIPNDKNSKDQNASQIRLLQKNGSTCMFGTFRHSNFEFVSDFDIRISSLLSSQIRLKRYNPFNSHRQNRWINEDLKTTLYHGCTNHSKTKQTNQSISSLIIYLITWLRKGMKSLKHPESMVKPYFHSTTQGKSAKG